MLELILVNNPSLVLGLYEASGGKSTFSELARETQMYLGISVYADICIYIYIYIYIYI